jgi:chromatin assembly factor 1 subunit B
MESLPILSIGPFERAVVVLRPHPKLFKPDANLEGDVRTPKILNIDYKMVVAIGTQDTIFIYDINRFIPIGFIKDLHCATLTDITWSPDGLLLFASSSDGYCSVIQFEENELGCFLSQEEQAAILNRHRIPKEAPSSPAEPIVRTTEAPPLDAASLFSTNNELSSDAMASEPIAAL